MRVLRRGEGGTHRPRGMATPEDRPTRGPCAPRQQEGQATRGRDARHTGLYLAASTIMDLFSVTVGPSWEVVCACGGPPFAMHPPSFLFLFELKRAAQLEIVHSRMILA